VIHRSQNSLTTTIFNAQIALKIHQKASVGGRGFALDPTGGVNGAPPDPIAGR
jgi:hypothetical protein